MRQIEKSLAKPEFIIGQTVHKSTQWLSLETLLGNGIIVGEPDSGKLWTIQTLCEGLSRSGVPVVATDCTGRLSGLARPGNGPNASRTNKRGYPVVLWDPRGEQGHRLPTTSGSGFFRRDYVGLGCINLIALTTENQQAELYCAQITKLLQTLTSQASQNIDPPQTELSPGYRLALAVVIEHAELLFQQTDHCEETLSELFRQRLQQLNAQNIALILCTESPQAIPDWLVQDASLRIVHRLSCLESVSRVLPDSQSYHQRTTVALKPGTAFIACKNPDKSQGSPTLIAVTRPGSQLAALSAEIRHEIIARSAIVREPVSDLVQSGFNQTEVEEFHA